jgi:hypothetical protein
MIYSHYITDKAELEVVVRDVFIRCRGVVEMTNWPTKMGWNIDLRRKIGPSPERITRVQGRSKT